jgi:hypothetical protein
MAYLVNSAADDSSCRGATIHVTPGCFGHLVSPENLLFSARSRFVLESWSGAGGHVWDESAGPGGD